MLRRFKENMNFTKMFVMFCLLAFTAGQARAQAPGKAESPENAVMRAREYWQANTTSRTEQDECGKFN